MIILLKQSHHFWRRVFVFNIFEYDATKKQPQISQILNKVILLDLLCIMHSFMHEDSAKMCYKEENINIKDLYPFRMMSKSVK